MVQNKQLEKEKTIENGEVDDALGSHSKITNGIHEDESFEESEEEEDDYLQYLTVVPTLDKSVEDRNMSLIAQSLMNFYTAIESRKEYQRIKQELMESYVPNDCKKEDEVKEEVKVELMVEETIICVHQESEQINEVTKTESETEAIETRKITLQLHKAPFVPETNIPSMYDQFFVCRRCKIFFTTRKFRKMHNVINHRRKKEEPKIEKPKRIRLKKREPLTCDLCAKSFRIKALIRSHMNCHLSEKNHQCTHCPYASKRFQDLKKHIQVHHDPNRVIIKRPRLRRCRVCQEVLPDKKAFRTHMRLNHPKERAERKPRIYKKCEKCEEVLYSKKSFILHIKEKHAELLIIKCEQCNRKFKTNFRLRKHQARYVDKDCRIKVMKPGEFACEHCGVKFTLKSHLSLHMRKHRTYTCEECKQEFKTQTSLKYHEFSHQELEPKCLHCEKIFTSEQKFSNHLKKKSCMHNHNGHVPDIIAT